MTCSRALNKGIILSITAFFLLTANGVYAKNFEVSKIDSIFNNFYGNGFTNKNQRSVEFFDGKIGMANPAAIYCNELGYQYKIVNTEKGQYGVCIFPDKSECEEWQFLTGKCGQNYSYCARQGYDLIIRTDGKDSLSKDYAVCIDKISKKEIGSVTELFSLSEKSTKGIFSSGQSSIVSEVPVESLPSFFDWRNVNGSNWMTTVKDQVACGSCWAFSSVGVTEAVTNIYKSIPNSSFDLSEEYLVSDCSDAGSCCGGQADKALDFISHKGIPDEGCMPYADTNCGCSATCGDFGSCTYNAGSQCSNAKCSDRCSNWQSRLTKIDEMGRVPSNQTVMKQYLIDKGPLVVAIGIGSNFGGYWDSNNIYRCTIDSGSNHNILITGYNDTGGYWILKNSWGVGWPTSDPTYTGPDTQGYFKLGYGECAVESWVMYADSKVNCGGTIIGNAVLNQDLLNCPGNGITIGASNIVLDCQGHTINGTSTGGNYGIDNSNGYSNVTIKNCVIKGFFISMEFYNGGTGARIINNNVSSCSYSGIRLAMGPNKNIVSGNIVSNCGTIGTGGAGIEVTNSNYNVLTDNIANNNIKGFGVSYGSNNILINNIISNNSNYGIWVRASSNNKFANNYFYNNAINAWDDGTNYWNMTKSSEMLNGNLVGHWKFDEGSGTTASDSSVFGNNGNIYGASWSTNCKYGKCLDFDGANDYVEVPSSSSLNIVDPMTVEAWVYPKFGSQNRNFAAVAKMTSVSGGNSKFSLELAGSGPSPIPIMFWVNDGDWQGVSSTTSLADNTWYHVAGVYDGSYIRIYINSVEEGTPVAQGNPSSSYETLQIGSSQKENRWGKWIIDEVKIYNRALSAAEIIQEYQNGTFGKNIIGGPYIGGNYWSDYTGNDNSIPPDGIGDTSLPYNSNGNILNGGDYLPLVYSFSPNITSCPYTVNAPGTYILTQSLTSNGTCITINSNNVVLDCHGYKLTGNNTGYGINSTGVSGNTIKNCVITNFDRGIRLSSSSNNILTNNTANSNYYGIELRTSSNNNTLTNNTVNSNQYGIWLEYSSNNTLTNNNASSSSQIGIYLNTSSNNTLTNNTLTNNTVLGIEINYYSNNNLLTGNTVNNNYNIGIELDHYSNNNLLTGNTVNNNYVGILLYISSNNIFTGNTVNSNTYLGIQLHISSNNNIFTGNTVNSNVQYGILLYPNSSNNNILTGNTVNSNLYGIALYYSSNNIIYNNYFNNSFNALDSGNNFWNTTKTLGTNIIGGPFIGGNYWSDYNGVDTSNPLDGIGDTLVPYTSNGNIANGGDYLPLVPTLLPNITIFSPVNNTSYYKLNVSLNFTISNNASQIAWIGYSLNNTDNKTITGPVNLTNITNGWNNITVFANDSFNNMGSSFVKFFYCLGDVSGPILGVPDGKVDISDVAFVSKRFGASCGDPSPSKPTYDARADINDDCKIDITDVAIVSKKFGKTCK
jgi:parallel beta-helix repeat protein